MIMWNSMEKREEPSDRQLLREFAADGKEEAFASLVRRHIGLVYSAAFRQLHDSHLAEDVAQAVFVLLARKARTIRHTTVLAGWLYRSAQYLAQDLLKSEKRRRKREEAAVTAETDDPSADSRYLPLAGQLDHALSQLAEKDRVGILLRYFENKSFRDIGSALGVSEEAARKRVERAVERLRLTMGRNAALTIPAIELWLRDASRETMPPGLEIRVSTAVLAGSSSLTFPVVELVSVALRALLLSRLKRFGATACALVLVCLFFLDAFQPRPPVQRPSADAQAGPAILQNFPRSDGVTGRVGTACMNCHRTNPPDERSGQ